MKGWILIFGLIFGSGALAQDASPVLVGSWTATAGPNQILRGGWSAQSSLRNPNAARGSWTLLNDAGEILLQGTWSAQKTGQGWRGTWTARPAKGQPLSGTWTADASNLSAKSLAEMLKETATKEVAGSWQTGRYQGNWWLKGSPQQGSRYGGVSAGETAGLNIGFTNACHLELAHSPGPDRILKIRADRPN